MIVINCPVCHSKVCFILGVTLNIYFLRAYERITTFQVPQKLSAIKTCDLHLSRKFLSTLRPISAPSEDEEDTSEVKGWSSSYFCKPLKKTTHTDPNLSPALGWPLTFSYPVRSSLTVTQRFICLAHSVCSALVCVCVSRFMNEPGGPNWQGFLTRWCVCADGTSCQKIVRFPVLTQLGC